MSTSTANATTMSIVCNSLNTPIAMDSAFIVRSPNGVTMMNNAYDKYLVYGCKLKITISNLTTS